MQPHPSLMLLLPPATGVLGRGPPNCATPRVRGRYKGEREGGTEEEREKKNLGGEGWGGRAKGALSHHVTGTRCSSVGHFRWSAAAPLKRGGGKSGRRWCLFFFSAAGESGSVRRARVGGEGGRPGRGAGAFAATRAPSLSCVLREVERARGSGGDYFAASFGSRQRRRH
ncbi:uncharacterized protein LOC115892636 [Rhinopithecus roxellana]|uniref:uncharacterized protein LOC115892636 n=1 Tax=Rhinopithecus roxellana TaxID=61622 RepID=UPI001237181C|nr:uncharacterized protein LOC115892636 [Rhinopithecus roxellana]